MDEKSNNWKIPISKEKSNVLRIYQISILRVFNKPIFIDERSPKFSISIQTIDMILMCT